MHKFLFICFLLIFTACWEGNKTRDVKDIVVEKERTFAPTIDYDSTIWKEITESDGVILDLKYGTMDNFTKNRIYDCSRCFLKKESAEKVIRLQRDIFRRYGLSLIIYDCYRPKAMQQRLWDMFPNPNYVTHPDKGSMHSRGIALDLSIVGKNGEVWDMGSDFDHFGREAHMDNSSLSKRVLKNRTVLKEMMNTIGFKGIRTEWWHYSDREVKSGFSDWRWSCK